MAPRKAVSAMGAMMVAAMVVAAVMEVIEANEASTGEYNGASEERVMRNSKQISERLNRSGKSRASYWQSCLADTGP